MNVATQLIRRHGGRLGFEDARGGAAIFFFELPSFSGATAGDPRALIDTGEPPTLPGCDGVA